jgi:uncharacterized protein (DUF952 family)
VTARTVYHIATEDDWRAAEAAGSYRGGAAARSDGFLHFSTAEQIVESAAKHWAGRAGVLLAVEAAKLGASLTWEPSRGGKLFPHVYGDVSLTAVLSARPLILGPDGRHVFPRLES